LPKFGLIGFTPSRLCHQVPDLACYTTILALCSTLYEFTQLRRQWHTDLVAVGHSGSSNVRDNRVFQISRQCTNNKFGRVIKTAADESGCEGVFYRRA
jgi:hypothetical protein